MSSFANAVRGLTFQEWLLIAEGIDANIGGWIKSLAHYARPEERGILDRLIDLGFLKALDGGEYGLRTDYDVIVRTALKEKRKEDMNWLAFSLGYLSTKAFRKEDLEMAIDQLERMKSAGEVTRADIGRLGWMQIGASMHERIAEYTRRSQQVSKRQSKKMAERGEIAPEDAHLVSHVAKEGRFDLYYLKPARTEDDITARHRLLCKYGKGTGWCTADPGGTYHRYYKHVGIFIVHSNGQPKYQFVDCGDVPERERRRSRDEDEYEAQEDSIAQFMDVDDNPVESLTPEEQKFLKRHADLSCYDLVPEGFEDWEDFMSSSDEKVRASSGTVAANVLIMSGDNVGVAMRRLGPALSKMSESNIYLLVHSAVWGPAMADQILDSLRGPMLEQLSRAPGHSDGISFGIRYRYVVEGLRGLMTRALASSSNPTAKVRGLEDFVDGGMISTIFETKGASVGDGFLRALLDNKKDIRSVDLANMIFNAKDTKGMLEAIGKRFAILAPMDVERLITSMSRRNDGSEEVFSKFMEANILELPVEAVAWVLSSSSDKEAAAKRLLAMNLDEDRIRMIFRVPEVQHLADDSHIRTITKKGKNGRNLVALASAHGRAPRTDERIERTIRFLKNSDDLEGREVAAAINDQMGMDGGEELVRRLPQEMIDLMSDEDIAHIAEKVEKSCEGGWGRNSTPREGCSIGEALVALLQRVTRHFPMDYASFMKEGKERDELLVRNLKGASVREVRRAVDLASDVDAFADEVVKMRGEGISPGEMASIIGHSTDKKRFLKRFAGRINSFSSPYESYEGRRVYSLDDSEDWMDMLMSFRGSGEILDDVLALYRRPFRPKAIFGMIKNSEDQGSTVEKLAGSIRDLSDEDYIRLQKMMRGFNEKVKDETLVLVDEKRNGGPMSKGQVVAAVQTPYMKVEAVPEGEYSWVKRERVTPGEKTLAGKSETVFYKIDGVADDMLVLYPLEEFEISIGGHKKRPNKDWIFSSPKKYFIRLG